MPNPVRTCIGCATEDDHPRHVQIALDGTALPMHMDCCALARRCEVCQAQLEGVGGVTKNPKGDELRKHLVKTSSAAGKPGWTAPVDTEPAAADTEKG